MSQYESIIKNICKKSSNEYYDSLLKNNHNKTISQNKNKYQNGDIPALVKLGANIEQAKAITFFRKRYWNLSLFIGIYITNKRLQQKGLVMPLDHYLKVHTAI